MKKIAVFSDLHIRSSHHDFPYQRVKALIDGFDYIFGLGDYTTNFGLDILYSFNIDVFAVCGNMDNSQLRQSLSTRIKLDIEDITVGLIHGWGAPYRLREKIMKEFTAVDLICYGHTHEAYWGNEHGIYFFNPGAGGHNPFQFGKIIIDGKHIDTELIEI